MDKNFKNVLWVFILLFISVTSYAQNDVTQFLDIPVDGYKPEMIKKLQSKGFTISQFNKDVLTGEFNGTDVIIQLVTNNNKMWRIVVSDAIPTDETNIKIRFNKLLKQFDNNSRYLDESDSILAKYTIPNDENISYEMTVNKKRYEAVFYQKSLKYDSVFDEFANLTLNDTLSDTDSEKIESLLIESVEETINSMNKLVWFTISQNYGQYRIVIYYDNEFNKADGSSL